VNGIHILGIVEQANSSFDLASSKSKTIVDFVVSRCPIYLNIRSAELDGVPLVVRG
jgi:hypothetical protein